MADVKCHTLTLLKSVLIVTLLVAMIFSFTAYKFTRPHNYGGTASRDDLDPRLIDASYNTNARRNRTVRILCLILTMEKDIATKVKAINETWATRCDKYFYVISSSIKHPDFLSIDIPDSRETIVHKIRKAYEIIYEKYMNDFDWIYKCDDDTYTVIDNLRFLLSHYNSSLPGYLGYHFNTFVKNGYMSGGAGYAFSNKALRLMVEHGYRTNVCEVIPRKGDTENSEDVETGACLEKVGVPVLSSLDSQGRETFHPYPLEKHLFGTLPEYMYAWAVNPVQKGDNCCSPYVISFHYVSDYTMYLMDHILYRSRVHGISSGPGSDIPAFRLGVVTPRPES